MRNRILKLLILVLLPLIPFMGISNAVLYDTEESSENYFGASSLELELQDENGDRYLELFFDKNKMKKNEALGKSIRVVKSGLLSFYYYPEFEFKNGNEDVCSELNLIAEKEGSEVYNGGLKEFDLATNSAQITGNIDEWDFAISHANEDKDLQGETCEFDMVFRAFQNINETGFSDTAKLSNKAGIAYEPELTAYYNTTAKKFIFTLSNLSNFIEFDYELTYDTDTISDQVVGNETLSSQNTKTAEIILGSCSATCTYYPNPHNFDLNINLVDIDGDTQNLSKQL